MTRAVTRRELVAALGMDQPALSRRAARESWPYTEDPCRGGRRRRYLVAGLPPDVQRALAGQAAPPADPAPLYSSGPSARRGRPPAETSEAAWQAWLVPILAQQATLQGQLGDHSRREDTLAELEDLHALAQTEADKATAILTENEDQTEEIKGQTEEIKAQTTEIAGLRTALEQGGLGVTVAVGADGEIDPEALLARLRTLLEPGGALHVRVREIAEE